jgi:hypothetical protein
MRVYAWVHAVFGVCRLCNTCGWLGLGLDGLCVCVGGGGGCWVRLCCSVGCATHVGVLGNFGRVLWCIAWSFLKWYGSG